MATREQDAFLRSLEEEKSEPARRSAAMRGRFMQAAAGSGLSVSVGRAAAQSDRTNTGPVNFTVTFNRPVTGFTNTDVSFAGSTVGGTLAAAVTGTGPYNVAVTGMTGDGIVSVSIPAGAATDAAGNLTPVSKAATVMFDTTAPTVTINQAAGQPDPVATGPINFTVVFSSTVTGFAASDVSLAGSTATGTLSIAVTGTGATYNVAVSGMTGNGSVVASIPAGGVTDMAGNANLASTSTDNVVAFNVSAAQFPNLLSGYSVRPGWQVAGVDFYVGYSPATTFKHPLTDTLPLGVSRDGTGHFFTVNGNNVTVDGWDFSEDGGWQAEVTANNCTIQNCKFIVGVNNRVPIYALSGGFITVQDCTLSGGTGSTSALMGGAGLLVQRCRFTGFPDDCIDAVVAGDFTVINNLFDTLGAVGFHSDVFQTYNNVNITSIRLSLNTVYQPASHPTDGINSFIRTGDMGAHLVKDLESAQNTLIFLDAGGSANVWQLATAETGIESARNFLVRDNYVDPTRVSNAILTAFYQVPPDATNPMSWRNIDLRNGNTLLWGPFNNPFSGVPSTPPSAPVISTAVKVGSTAQLTGTAQASSVVDILNPDETGRWPLALYGTATSNGAGAWTFTSGVLTAGLHNFVARVSDGNMNTSDASATSAVTI